MKLFGLKTFVAAALLTVPAFAERAKHDVTQYDIAGVKLGMSMEDAIDAVVTTLGVSRDDVSLGYPKDDPISGEEHVTSFEVSTEDYELRVVMAANVPPNADVPMVVYSVSFVMPRTPQNQASMKARAIEKYGAPTHGSADEPAHFPAEWCTLKADQPHASCVVSGGPYLKLDSGFSGNELTLYDQSYVEAVKQYMNNEKSSAPKF